MKLGFEPWQCICRVDTLNHFASLHSECQGCSETASHTLGSIQVPALRASGYNLLTSCSCFSCRVSLCLRSPICCQKPHTSCRVQNARDSSLRPNGDTGTTVQRCSPTQRTRDQAPPSSSVMKALSRAQACSSVAVLNFGKKIWKGAT